jgi:hypothetical protein
MGKSIQALPHLCCFTSVPSNKTPLALSSPTFENINKITSAKEATTTSYFCYFTHLQTKQLIYILTQTANKKDKKMLKVEVQESDSFL